MKKLYKVAVCLTNKGLIWKINEYDFTETDKTYRYSIVKENSETKVKSIHKSTILKLSDRFLPTPSFIATSTF